MVPACVYILLYTPSVHILLYTPLCPHTTVHPPLSILQKREEDERSVQELLEQNAQLELEKQRM